MNELISSITEIANHPKFSEALEPNTFCHQKIEKWMTQRVLYAYALFNQEMIKETEEVG